MRVERFSLFFGPLLVKFRRGETEYGIGPIPLGGYVKITGMSPREEIPEEVLPRAYYNQAVWKRIVVILAGPAVNLLIAFLILMGFILSKASPPRATASPCRWWPRHDPGAGLAATSSPVTRSSPSMAAQPLPSADRGHRQPSCAGTACPAARRRRRCDSPSTRPDRRSWRSVRATTPAGHTRLGFEFTSGAGTGRTGGRGGPQRLSHVVRDPRHGDRVRQALRARRRASSCTAWSGPTRSPSRSSPPSTSSAL